MRVFIHSAQTTGTRKRFAALDLSILILTIAIQVVLALFFGHYYDMRIFMATGYLVGTGQNPYVPQDLTAVFRNNFFQGMTTIGYPPPWLLVLGFLYRSSYALYPNLFLYNLAIKIPIILANLGIAYLVADILKNLGAEALAIRRAWIFLLVSPFLLYFGSAWGQFDSIVALLSLSSLVLLHSGKLKSSALLIALAISFKPIAIPIFPVELVYLMGRSLRQTITYSVTVFVGVLLFCVAPFIIFGWDPSPIFRGWNAHFTVGGGMSFMTFFELLKDTYQLPGRWWLLGLAWVPALGIGILALKPRIKGFVDLIKKSAALILVFFLTRTWLSEPNVILILPFVVILASIGELNSLFLLTVWVFPLVFTFFNTSTPQLLFLSFPEAMERILIIADNFRAARLLIRTALVVPWHFAGWWMVITLLRKSSAPSDTGR